MFHKNIKLFVVVLLFAYAIFQFIESYIGNGIMWIFLGLIVLFLYFKNELILLAFLRLRKQDFTGTEKWLSKIRNPKSALTRKQQGYYNFLKGIMVSQTNMNESEKFFKTAISLGLSMDHDLAMAKLNLAGIAFHSSINKAISIIDEFNPKYVYCESSINLNSIQDSIQNLKGKEFLKEKSELESLLNHNNIDIIISAISGFSGLETTYMASKTGKIILLANKESIVVAGDIILPLAVKHNTKIIPIDSEHNAIFQCLDSDKNTDDVSKIIITASGGPFLSKNVKDLSGVTKKEALNHPNWKMGKNDASCWGSLEAARPLLWRTSFSTSTSRR